MSAFDKSLATWIYSQQPQDDRSERSTRAGRNISQATFQRAPQEEPEPLEKAIPAPEKKADKKPQAKKPEPMLIVRLDQPAPPKKDFGTSSKTGKPYKKPMQVIQDNESPRRQELKKSLETVARLCPLKGEKERQLSPEERFQLEQAQAKIFEII